MKATALVIVFLLAPSLASAQDSTIFAGPSAGIGARLSALGDASVADASDAGSIYSNPAAITFLQSNSFFAGHFQEFQLHAMQERMAFAFRIGGRDAIGIGGTVNHLGYLGAGVPASLKFFQYTLDLAFARAVTSTFSVGGRVNAGYGKNLATHFWSGSTAIGVFYAPAPNLNYGAVYSGIGEVLRYHDDGSSITVTKEPLPRTLEIGAAMHFPASARQRIFSVALANEKVFDRSGLRYKGGVEVYPAGFLVLRIGQIVESTEAETRIGAGLISDICTVDYAMSVNRVGGEFYEISFVFGL